MAINFNIICGSLLQQGLILIGWPNKVFKNKLAGYKLEMCG